MCIGNVYLYRQHQLSDDKHLGKQTSLGSEQIKSRSHVQYFRCVEPQIAVHTLGKTFVLYRKEYM